MPAAHAQQLPQATSSESCIQAETAPKATLRLEPGKQDIKNTQLLAKTQLVTLKMLYWAATRGHHG
jgi:hypothetical protein